jgi:hypothetical protein
MCVPIVYCLQPRELQIDGLTSSVLGSLAHDNIYACVCIPLYIYLHIHVLGQSAEEEKTGPTKGMLRRKGVTSINYICRACTIVQYSIHGRLVRGLLQAFIASLI